MARCGRQVAGEGLSYCILDEYQDHHIRTLNEFPGTDRKMGLVQPGSEVRTAASLDQSMRTIDRVLIELADQELTSRWGAVSEHCGGRGIEEVPGHLRRS